MKELQDIKVMVTDGGGDKLELTIPWDDTTDDWGNHLKRIMVFLEFGVDAIEINPEKEKVDE
jgi:hypothetical protein